MKKRIKTTALLILISVGQIAYGQTDKEKALSKGEKAVELMDNGKIDEGIKLLEEAQKLDPHRFDYPYELAYAYYSKENFTEAIKILEKNINHKDVTEKLFQMLGNSYDVLGETEKAFESYDSGLKNFLIQG